jgi:cytochrome bd-type quinol oxidase subunit 2
MNDPPKARVLVLAGLLFGMFMGLNMYFDTARWRWAIAWALGLSVYFALAMAVGLAWYRRHSRHGGRIERLDAAIKKWLVRIPVVFVIALIMGALRFEESWAEQHRSLGFSVVAAIVVVTSFSLLGLWAREVTMRRAQRQPPRPDVEGST